MMRTCAQRVGADWLEATADMRTFTSTTFEDFWTQALAVAFWTAALQKQQAHEQAHLVEVQPVPSFAATPSFGARPKRPGPPKSVRFHPLTKSPG